MSSHYWSSFLCQGCLWARPQPKKAYRNTEFPIVQHGSFQNQDLKGQVTQHDFPLRNTFNLVKRNFLVPPPFLENSSAASTELSDSILDHSNEKKRPNKLISAIRNPMRGSMISLHDAEDQVK